MTTPAKPTIELKKITVHKGLSEETHAYTAQVWVDGVHVCDASNHGHGGCDMQHPAKGKTHSDIEKLEALIKATFPEEKTGMVLDGKPFMFQPTLESICADLVTNHLLASDLTRLLKRTVAFEQGGQVRSYKGKHIGEARAHLVTETLRKHPGAKVLNNMPFAEALKIYKETAGA
jgi:hypothetical protein